MLAGKCPVTVTYYEHCYHTAWSITCIVVESVASELPCSLQLGGEGGATTDNELSTKVRWMLRVGAVCVLPITSTLPSVSPVCSGRY